MRFNTTSTRASVVALALLGLGALATQTGCVEQEASLILRGNVLASGDFDEDTQTLSNCAYEPSVGTDTPIVVTGQANIATLRAASQPGSAEGAGVFFFGANLTNTLLDSSSIGGGGGGGASGPQLYANNNQFIAKSAEVKLQFRSGTFSRERFFSTVIDPEGSSITVGVPLLNGLADLDEVETLLDADLGGADPSSTVTVIAQIKVLGETFSGTNIESNTFEYPITFCKNCSLGVTPLCVPGA